MLVYADGDAAPALAAYPSLDRTKSAAELGRLFAKDKLVAIGDGSLTSTFPAKGERYIGRFDRVTIVAAREFSIDYPSQLDRRFLQVAAGRTVYLHAMHSVVDWLAFAVWRDGSLLRALSVSPDRGVIEECGSRLPFELPYWEGKHPVDSSEKGALYPLRFHPLDLGDSALRSFFGYSLDSPADAALVDTDRIPLLKFKRRSGFAGFW
jgi:hypothetical protein